jgi:hypothetical protein
MDFLLILILDTGRLEFDQDLLARSIESTETLVKMGDSLARPGPNAGKPSSAIIKFDSIYISTVGPTADKQLISGSTPARTCCVCS